MHEAIERAVSNVIPSITVYSFASVFASLSISLSISVYERRVGRSTSSMILLADSSHTLTDVAHAFQHMHRTDACEKLRNMLCPSVILLLSCASTSAEFGLFRKERKLSGTVHKLSELTR